MIGVSLDMSLTTGPLIWSTHKVVLTTTTSTAQHPAVKRIMVPLYLSQVNVAGRSTMPLSLTVS